jgi:hypothetical protein
MAARANDGIWMARPLSSFDQTTQCFEMQWLGLEGAMHHLSHSIWKCLIEIRNIYKECKRMAHWNSECQ